MAELNAKPFPPGKYRVVVVGSGPGGLQVSYCLSRAGVEHAVISADAEAGGMFLKFPLFQRLITWSKMHAPIGRGQPGYDRFDWNSLLAEEPPTKDLVPNFMDQTSYFPSRAEMQSGLQDFADKGAVRVRFGCRWESTKRHERGFTLTTSDGEYRCELIVFAIGVTQPWKPTIPGLEQVPHYVETKAASQYAGQRVFIIGKRNSGFEVADGLLPWARQLILASPRPAVISVKSHSTASARARYLQPYEDHVLGGGNLVLDAAIDRVERHSSGYRVIAKGTTYPGDYTFDVDAVIAATGFTTPLGDLPELGVATFYSARLPAQTPFWESASVPGIYFAGSVTQGAVGLKKYGIPSNSAAVHGFRYNAQVLASHIAQKHFGISPTSTRLETSQVVAHLLEAVASPALWNQQSYLCRVVSLKDDGVLDEGLQPLSWFLDSAGPDAAAITIETDGAGNIHPALYVRRGGHVSEHVFDPSPLLEFSTASYHADVSRFLEAFLT